MKSIKLMVILFLLCSVTGLAQIESAWRGPDRNGIYPDKGLLTQWPEDGPEIIWHYDNLGEGYSSASFYNDKIYMSGNEDTTGYIYVLDMNGSLLWKKPYGRAYTGSFPNTRTTPLVTDGKIYMYTGYGVLTCMNAENGDKIWVLDTQKELDGRNITWGVTENLLIDGDKLFCSPGGEKYNVIAVNKNTGKLIWSSPGLGDLSAYCSPVVIPRKGRKILVTMMASHIQGHDTETGEMLWSYEQPNQWSVHANTPVYADNAIACVSGYGKGTVKLNLNEDGSQVTKAWFNEELDNRIGAFVKWGDYLYGSGDKNRGWHCVNWKTGESKYYDKSLANGVVIAADGMLICYSDRGELALVKAEPDKFNILSQTKVNLGTMQHWAHPVIKDGKLYLRHGKSLIVYKIK
ncbi:PQQ-binding-like beta-propeller repeat protein [Saccharicrinis sp. FJH2]|uniref:outer membrane protein assembly factor BamB family protein n=1 Tax=Saccharicrinis sp. FJH65 TaxID=3344659 RepID=UPI0035F4E066